MKTRAILSLILSFTAIVSFAGKTTKIKLTGTAHEVITMTIGNTGRTEVISDFPYIFEVPKHQMPVKLTFTSDNYLYYAINVPKKPFDTTGHVYLVKINEDAMALRGKTFQAPASVQVQNNSIQENNKPVITHFDSTKGVNSAPVTGSQNPDTYALIIANEQYEMAAKVDNATNDGLAFKEYCIKTLGLPEKNVRYYDNLTFGKMRKAFNDMIDIASIVDENSSLLIYYAGHGIPDNSTKDAFLMPVDADGTDTNVCISLKDLYGKLNATHTKKNIVFLDACFSGAQRGGDMIVAARGVKLKPQEAAPKGNTIVFSATSGDEAAYSYKEEGHGLFTYFLLKKLQESSGKVNLGELANYLIKNVGVQSRLINNQKQTPIVTVAPAVAEEWKSMKLMR